MILDFITNHFDDLIIDRFDDLQYVPYLLVGIIPAIILLWITYYYRFEIASWLSLNLFVKNYCPPFQDVLKITCRNNTPCQLLDQAKQQYGITLKDWDILSEKVRCTFPYQGNYGWIRFDFNKRKNVFPFAIVHPKNEDQVKIALNFCKEFCLPFRIRSGGHDFEAFSTVQGIIIDLLEMKEIIIDKHKKTALIGPGVSLGDLIIGLSKEGFALPTGTCPNVGISGLTLGGGIGYLLRTYGLTCDRLISFRMINAQGKILYCDEKSNCDLFWAYRGSGGGNFGIVIEFEFSLISLKKVVTFKLTWDFCDIKKVINAWQRWGYVQPNQISSQLGVKNSSLPILITGQYNSICEKHQEETLLKLLKPLLDCAKPEKVEIETKTWEEAQRGYGASVLRRPFLKVKGNFICEILDNKAISTIKKNMEKIPKFQTQTGFEWFAWGGKVSQVPDDATAFPHRKGFKGLILFATYWSDPSQDCAQLGWIDTFHEEMARWFSPASYVNFMDSDLVKWKKDYYGKNLERLIQVKRKYDPQNLFSFQRSIPLEENKESLHPRHFTPHIEPDAGNHSIW